MNENVLNPTLYATLRSLFGRVEVANPGQEATIHYTRDRKGRVSGRIQHGGEEYRVNCFFCHDQKQRLYINHRFGVKDPQTGYRTYAAHCFNEECHEDHLDDLKEMIDTQSRLFPCQADEEGMVLRPGSIVEIDKPIPLPADFVRLNRLPSRHRAVRYVQGRQFDPAELAQRWGIGYSREVDQRSDSGRLVIPLYRGRWTKDELAGWQARAIVEEDEPKYRYPTGLRKSRLLYGLHRTGSTGPVLIMEGVTDVWRAGKKAVALLGKAISSTQLQLIRQHFHGRPLVVMLDSDAAEDAEALVEKIKRERTESILLLDTSPVVMARLPSGRDPADLTTEQIWKLARRSLAKTAV